MFSREFAGKLTHREPPHRLVAVRLGGLDMDGGAPEVFEGERPAVVAGSDSVILEASLKSYHVIRVGMSMSTRLTTREAARGWAPRLLKVFISM